MAGYDASVIKPKHILIACTGSVATIKLPLLLDLFRKEFSDCQIELSVIVTEKAKHFFDINDIPSNIKIYSDEDEWENWKKRGDPVLHIELAKWADAMIIAPLDANTLAKISQVGICDNLLTCTTRAWIIKKPLFFCPAMNTKMWEHPITSQQIGILKSWGYIEIPSIQKTLICGDTGMGAMAEISTIVEYVKQHMSK